MKVKKRYGLLLTAVFALSAAGCGSESSEYLQQGMAQISALEYENALASFDAAIANDEDLQLIYRGQGLAYMGLTDYENAALHLEKALTLSDYRPDQLDYDVNYYLATAYYKGGQIEKAIAVYEAITALRPDEKAAWFLKGTMELELGRTEAAQTDFDRAVSIGKTDYDLYIDIFNSCDRFGQRQMGEAYLQNLMADDSLKLSNYDSGRINFYLENYEEARLSLEKAKENGGADAVSMLGQTYEKLGDYNYAASVYSTYLEAKQPNAEIYNQLGLCKLKLEEYEEALAAFQAGLAIDGNPVMQTLKFNEIVAYEYLGQFDKAKLSMKQYLALYPDDEKAQREYIFLQTR